VCRKGRATMEEVFSMLYNNFPDEQKLQGVIAGAVRAGRVRVMKFGMRDYLCNPALTAGAEASSVPLIPTLGGGK